LLAEEKTNKGRDEISYADTGDKQLLKSLFKPVTTPKERKDKGVKKMQMLVGQIPMVIKED